MKTNYFLGVSTDGFHRVAYTEWGQPDTTQPTVFCVHGLLRNRHDFYALANFLSLQERHIFCPDIAGRGDSDWFKNPQHYTFEQYIADMTGLVARSSATQIDWIGTSMGGLIGMMMAALPNSPIRRLVLNDIGPQIPLHGCANPINLCS
jgi:pimeloyl-ACP methyl ester carboxylesterase